MVPRWYSPVDTPVSNGGKGMVPKGKVDVTNGGTTSVVPPVTSTTKTNQNRIQKISPKTLQNHLGIIGRVIVFGSSKSRILKKDGWLMVLCAELRKKKEAMISYAPQYTLGGFFFCARCY